MKTTKAALVMISSLALALATLASSCTDDPAPPGEASGGNQDCGWKCEPCGVCVIGKCQAAIDDCGSEPECVAWMNCTFGCEATANGDIDPECAGACDRGTSSAAIVASGAVDACRSEGAGETCSECPYQEPEEEPDSWPLVQECPNPSTETNPCFICEDTFCCETYVAAAAEPDSAAWRDCITACPPPESEDDKAETFACEYQCALDHPGGVQVQGPLQACMYYHCGVEQVACNETARSECETCMYKTCGEEWAALLTLPEGFLLHACILACPVGDSACDTGCYEAHPDGLEVLQNYGACLLAACDC